VALFRRLKHRYHSWLLRRRYPWQFEDHEPGPPRSGPAGGGPEVPGSGSGDAATVIVSRARGRVRIRWLTWVLLLVGAAFVALGIYYLITPAHSLPSFLPGHQIGVDRRHTKHGLAAITLGIVSWIGAWFTTKP
jgi:hypothetical protein